MKFLPMFLLLKCNTFFYVVNLEIGPLAEWTEKIACDAIGVFREVVNPSL
jgi:hypothetical protein